MNTSALFDNIVLHADALLQRLHTEEVRYRMCPVCRCDAPLEPHDEGCAYELLSVEIRLLRRVREGSEADGHIDSRRAAG